jgi:hypothetical protein
MEVTTLNCKKCGAPIELMSDEIKTIKCAYCNIINRISADKTISLGNTVTRKLVGPFKLGTTGRYKGTNFEIVGLLEYTGGGYTWWEYLIRFADFRVGWLQYDDGDLALFFKQRLKTQLPAKIVPNMRIKINNLSVIIEEVGSATISHIDGQIPFSVDLQEKIYYIDGYTDDDTLVSIERTEEETELFVGEEVSREQLGI